MRDTPLCLPPVLGFRLAARVAATGEVSTEEVSTAAAETVEVVTVAVEMV